MAATADQIVHTTDYDYGQLRVDTNLVLNVALRAKKLDQVTSAFIARHPDAVGIDLGAGLDTRFQRLAPSLTVDWYDVDLPAVATARDPDWLDAVPTGRPPHHPACRPR